MLTCEDILARATDLARGRPITQSNDVKIAKQILDRPRDYIGSADQNDTTGFEDLPEVKEFQRAANWPADVGHVRLVLIAVSRWQQYIAVQKAKEERLAAQAPASLPNVQLAQSYAAPPAEKPLGDPPDPRPEHYAGDPPCIHGDTPGAAALKITFLEHGKRWWLAVGEALAIVGYATQQISRTTGLSSGSGEVFVEFGRPDRPRSIVAWLTTAAVVPPALRWGGYMHQHLPEPAAPLRPDEDGMCALREDLVCVRARWKNRGAKAGEGSNIYLPALGSLGMAEALLREVIHDLDAAEQLATLSAHVASSAPAPRPEALTPEAPAAPTRQRRPKANPVEPAPEPAPEPTATTAKGRRGSKVVAPPPEPAPEPPPPPAAPVKRTRRGTIAEPPPAPPVTRKPIPPRPAPSSRPAPAPTPTRAKPAKKQPEPPAEGERVVQVRLL